MKKWKMIFAISLILTIIFMVLCGVLNADSTRGIWKVMKILFFVASVVDIISIIGCIVVSVKTKEKMPIWLTIIMVIVAVVVVMFVIGIMSQNEYEKAKENYSNNYINNSVQITMDKFKSIENGLTYNQVCEIIGFQGTLASEQGSIKEYTWTSNEQTIKVMFLNEKVMSKGQSGL